MWGSGFESRSLHHSEPLIRLPFGNVDGLGNSRVWAIKLSGFHGPHKTKTVSPASILF
jgi:hypothetical protein